MAPVWSLIGLVVFGQTVASLIARPFSEARSNRLTATDQELDSAGSSIWLQSSSIEPSVYKCAKHCSCSMVQVPDWTGDETAYRDSKQPRQMVNLSQVKCESSQFSDLLTIDRRTQIIYISLPKESQQQTKSSESQPTQANTLTNAKVPKRNQLSLMSKLFNVSSQAQFSSQLESKGSQSTSLLASATTINHNNQFRMPRLMQFAMLREIVIINLRIEVCDSEVFKRGQRLMRLKWNGNSLKQASKSCFKHLDKLLDLNLDHNRLGELESALFSYLTALKHLSLAHNQLTDLAAHQFANLSQLISLNLVGNSFKSINLNLLEPMQNSLQFLALANNQIRSFVLNQSTQSISPASGSGSQSQVLLSGVIFRNLIKLNVDFNQFERIKLLQLHRFYNVKFLSIRGNNIAIIRDKAFNGLKLVELNLAQNKLQSISRCAFCNSTIKRLNLAENNISTPSFVSLAGPTLTAAHSLVAVDPLTAATASNGDVPQQAAPPLVLSSPASSASMLVLGQSIFGPLFNHLEYLDLSHNLHLANQLEVLLEPLLELQYLNLAAIGLDRSLPTPSLFKNLRRLTYLNLSNNHLDQLVTETIEPLKELQLLDLSRNDLSELEESFLVTLDELPMIKLVDFGSNPWYCSQCKISSLYEWILRSPIYNATCLGKQRAKSTPDQQAGPDKIAPDEMANELDEEAIEPSLGFIYKQQARSSSGATSRTQANTYNNQMMGDVTPASIDFELILDLFQDDSSFSELISGASTSARSSASGGNVPNYQFDDSISLQQEFRARKRQLSRRLLRSLASPEDDNSIARTIESVHAISEAYSLNAADLTEAEFDNGGQSGNIEQVLKRFFSERDFCLKCEFPSELRSFYLHELIPTDFRYCAGSAPRTGASEPKVGLTLAIVIISALLVVIIVVIVMYRKKSNTYYLGDDLLESAENGQTAHAGRKNQPVLSVSSDMEHQYGDATDYSSPPMSQTYSNEDSFSGSNSQAAADDGDLDEEDEDQDDEDEYDEDEEEEEEDEDEEEDEEEEELDEEVGKDIDDGGDDDDDKNARGGREHAHFLDIDDGDHNNRNADHKQPQPPPSSAGPRGQNSLDNVSSLPPSSSSKQEEHRSQSVSTSDSKNQRGTNKESRFDHTLSPALERVTSISRTNSNEQSKSRAPSSQQQQQAPSEPISHQRMRTGVRRATQRDKSQTATSTRSDGLVIDHDQETPSRQSSHFDRDDSTPIYITRYETSANLSNGANNKSNLLTRALATSSTPASLSAADLINKSPPSLANTTTDGVTNIYDHEKLAKQRLAAGKANSASMSSGSQDAHRQSSLLAHGTQHRSADMSSETAASSTVLSRPAKHRRQPAADLLISSASEIIDSKDHHKTNKNKLRSATSVNVINVERTFLKQQHPGPKDNQQLGGLSLGRYKNKRQHRQSSEHSTAGSVSFADEHPVDSQGPDRNVAQHQAVKLLRSAQTIAYEGNDSSSDNRGVSIIQLVAAPTRQNDRKINSWGEEQQNGSGVNSKRSSECEVEQIQILDGRTIQGIVEPNTDSESICSNSKESARMQQSSRHRLSLRGRPLMKQRPREHYSPPSSLARRQISDESTPAAPNQCCAQRNQMNASRPAENFSSMELDEDDARLLDELPSDLDESNADLLTASDTTTSNGGLHNKRPRLNLAARYQTQSGPALDFDEEEEEDERKVEAASGEESIEQLHGLGLMRMSHSTHSALTRAGSRDFE